LEGGPEESSERTHLQRASPGVAGDGDDLEAAVDFLLFGEDFVIPISGITDPLREGDDHLARVVGMSDSTVAVESDATHVIEFGCGGVSR